MSRGASAYHDPCLVAGCERVRGDGSYGLCNAHANQFRRTGRITRIVIGQPACFRCSVPGCERVSRYTQPCRCRNHYEQDRRRKRDA